MYTINKSEFEFINKNLSNIIDEIEEKKLNYISPKIDEIRFIDDIVLNFVKEKKRKIYGGYSHNKNLIAKNKNDAIYDEKSISDIDIYSYDPITDMMELANILFEKGFKEVNATEAMHKETYAIFVNYRKVLDLSYVNKFIYDSIPTNLIDGFHYVHPHFALIDLYKIISDPYFSNFRWEKVFNRIYLLEKNYPYDNITSELPTINIYISPNTKDNKGNKITHINNIPNNVISIKNKVDSEIFNFIKNKESYLIFGDYLYNKYCETTKLFNPIKNPFLRIISSNYSEDSTKLLEHLINKIKECKKLTIKEYYPVWNLLGYTAYILYENYPIFSITNYGKVCHNYKIINNIKYCGFDRNFLLICSLYYYHKANKQFQLVNYFNCMKSKLIQLKIDFFNKNKKVKITDDTIFQKLIINCMGEIIDPMVENKLIKKKKYLAKKLVKFNYNPENGIKTPGSTYKFANTSGNIIIENIKNLKVIPFIYKKLPELEKEYKKIKPEVDLNKTFEMVVSMINENMDVIYE